MSVDVAALDASHGSWKAWHFITIHEARGDALGPRHACVPGKQSLSSVC